MRRRQVRSPDPSRRELVRLIGSVAAANMLGCNGDDPTTPTSTAAGSTGAGTSCVVRPQQTQGPYFVDERLNRSDIRADPSSGAVRAGIPLRLAFRVSRSSSGACSALANAMVDVWHCDALGIYSDASDAGFNTVGQKFLRGYQLTDAAGLAQFTTIYPGWYSGRAVHIHFKLRSSAGARRRLRVHVAAVLRRGPDGPGARAAALQRQRPSQHPQLPGRHLPGRRQPAPAHGRARRLGLRGDLRRRLADLKLPHFPVDARFAELVRRAKRG